MRLRSATGVVLLGLALVALGFLVPPTSVSAGDAPALPATTGPGFDAALRKVPGLKREKGFRPLLTGEAARAWRQCGPGGFVLRNGVATAEGGMGLWWYQARMFTNFVLRGEFLQEQPLADSGIFVRFPDPGQDPWIAVNHGHELEIGDPNPENPTWRTGSIYPFAASTHANTHPPGRWNTFQLACVGQHYAVWINGTRVTAWTDPTSRSTHGFLGLQNYNDDQTVRLRNLRLRELP